jgi:hypothetical protein
MEHLIPIVTIGLMFAAAQGKRPIGALSQCQHTIWAKTI